MESEIHKTMTFIKEDTQVAKKLKSLKPNASPNVSFSEINIHQYVREMSICPSEAIALNLTNLPGDTFEKLEKGPMNFLVVCNSPLYDGMFLYLSRQTNGETFGCTEDPQKVY